MGKKYPQLEPRHIEFINKQQLFFVSTATKDSRINVSPKDNQSLKIINANKILWLNYTGSGNETAAHLQEDSRMTLLFCSFDDTPNIVRIYGTAKAIHPFNANWKNTLAYFDKPQGARQIIQLNIDLVANACGFGVPIYEFVKKRTQLENWVQKKAEDGIKQYQQDNNVISLDGQPIKI